MAVLAPPVQVVASGAPPFVAVSMAMSGGAPPFVAVASGAPPITIVASGAPPITLLNPDGSIWTGGAGGVAPVLTGISPVDFSDVFVWGQVTTDTASGTLYAVVVGSVATTPSAAQIIAGTDAAGAAAPNASVAVTSTGAKQILVRGLTAVTTYKVCMTHAAAGGNSNVLTAAFTTDTLVAAWATNGLATGLTALTGAAAIGTNIADPHGGTNAVRFVDNNDAQTNQQVALQSALFNYFNGANKVHATVKFQSGAPWFRFNTAAITVLSSTHWNTSTGALGTTSAPWTPTPVIWDMGSGWKMFSGRVDVTGADVNGVMNFNKGVIDNSVVGITRDGTHTQDLYNIRVTRV